MLRASSFSRWKSPNCIAQPTFGEYRLGRQKVAESLRIFEAVEDNEWANQLFVRKHS